MLTERYFERQGSAVLFRIAVSDVAVLDVLMTDEDIDQCLQLLQSSLSGPAQTIRMGNFGSFDVNLTVWRDEATILIAGPTLGFQGEQAVGLYLQRADLLQALDESKEFQSTRRKPPTSKPAPA